MTKTKELNVKVSVIDAEPIRSMIELLSDRIDELPIDLQSSLRRVCESDRFEIGHDQLMSVGINSADVSIICDGKELGGVVSFNQALRRVTKVWKHEGNRHSIDGEIIDIYQWPLSLSVMCSGEKVEGLGW